MSGAQDALNKKVEKPQATPPIPPNKVVVPKIKLPPIPTAKLSFRIKPLAEAKEWTNTLVYGDFGTGKTTLAASAEDVAEMRDVLLLNVEAGERAIAHRHGIDAIDISNYAQFARTHEYLRLHCKARDAGDIEYLKKLEGVVKGTIPETPKQYRTVILDSLTEIQKYCMYSLINVDLQSYVLDMEPDHPLYAQWNKSTEMIRLLVRTFRDLPMHVIMVCSRTQGQDEKKQFHSKPALPGKLANEVQGFFDTVGYLVASPPTDTQPVRRRLYLEPGKTFQAKNRFHGFTESFMDEPTMTKLNALAKMK